MGPLMGPLKGKSFMLMQGSCCRQKYQMNMSRTVSSSNHSLAIPLINRLPGNNVNFCNHLIDFGDVERLSGQVDWDQFGRTQLEVLIETYGSRQGTCMGDDSPEGVVQCQGAWYQDRMKIHLFAQNVVNHWSSPLEGSGDLVKVYALDGNQQIIRN